MQLKPLHPAVRQGLVSSLQQQAWVWAGAEVKQALKRHWEAEVPGCCFRSVAQPASALPVQHQQVLLLLLPLQAGRRLACAGTGSSVCCRSHSPRSLGSDPAPHYQPLQVLSQLLAPPSLAPNLQLLPDSHWIHLGWEKWPCCSLLFWWASLGWQHPALLLPLSLRHSGALTEALHPDPCWENQGCCVLLALLASQHQPAPWPAEFFGRPAQRPALASQAQALHTAACSHGCYLRHLRDSQARGREWIGKVQPLRHSAMACVPQPAWTLR